MKKLQILILIQSIIVAVLLLGGCTSSPSSQSFARTVQVLNGNDGDIRVQPL